MKKLVLHFTTIGTATTCVVTDEFYSEIDWGEAVIPLTCAVNGKAFKIFTDKLRFVQVEDYVEE